MKKTYHVHGLEDLILLPKALYRVNANPIKSPVAGLLWWCSG